mmetsp:Transcript_40855/g.96083  ORF Transcript_40855/g.96083 Transcript_40855/m.96083 type:complete len:204 (+) Transcript_40855:520-1131(+)
MPQTLTWSSLHVSSGRTRVGTTDSKPPRMASICVESSASLQLTIARTISSRSCQRTCVFAPPGTKLCTLPLTLRTLHVTLRSTHSSSVWIPCSCSISSPNRSSMEAMSATVTCSPTHAFHTWLGRSTSKGALLLRHAPITCPRNRKLRRSAGDLLAGFGTHLSWLDPEARRWFGHGTSRFSPFLGSHCNSAAISRIESRYKPP